MVKDIALFYYYSSPSLPEGCFLGLSKEVVYRNMFLLNCSQDRVHFEFPMFEDHSYNTICERKGVRSLIKKPANHEKYIIFRTRDLNTGKFIITGYYKVKRTYYQETNMFNNNGFVWGIEAGEVHLIPRGTIEYGKVGRNYQTSWHNDQLNQKLNDLLKKIKTKKDISDLYQSETNRLVNLFKNQTEINKWRTFCGTCTKQKECYLYKRFKNYAHSHSSDMFSVIHNIYTSNVYSRNELTKIKKEYLE